MLENQSKELSENREDEITRQLWANGLCMKTTEVEAKLDEGNIQEAESSLREGLSLNSEVCFVCNLPNSYKKRFVLSHFFFYGYRKQELSLED